MVHALIGKTQNLTSSGEKRGKNITHSARFAAKAVLWFVVTAAILFTIASARSRWLQNFAFPQGCVLLLIQCGDRWSCHFCFQERRRSCHLAMSIVHRWRGPVRWEREGKGIWGVLNNLQWLMMCLFICADSSSYIRKRLKQGTYARYQYWYHCQISVSDQVELLNLVEMSRNSRTTIPTPLSLPVALPFVSSHSWYYHKPLFCGVFSPQH